MIKAETEYVRAKTSVWWDIENCEVPKGWDANMIAQNVSSALLKMNYCGPLSISAYGDTNLIPTAVQHALSSTGVGLNHVPAGVKDASDKRILVDMLLWAVDNPAPANFMLISGDRDFSNALHQLRMRRYNILLAQPAHASVPLVAAAKNVWLWKNLASGGLPLSEPSRLVNSGSSRVSYSEVLKLPVSEQAQSIKQSDQTSEARDTKNHITSISQAEAVAGRNAQTSVSAKPVHVGELVECTVCHIFTSKETFINHTYGKRHRNNLELQLSGKSDNMSLRSVDLGKQKKKKVREVREKPNANYVCRPCNVVCQSQVDFDSHLKGRKHAAMLIDQSEALVKKIDDKVVQEKDQPREATAQSKRNANHVCRLCNVVCQNQTDFDSHLKGKKHIAKLASIN